MIELAKVERMPRYITYHDRDSSLVLSVGELEIFLQASETSTRNVGSVENIENEDAEKGGDEMKIDLPDNYE
jgi:hypothetical protein